MVKQPSNANEEIIRKRYYNQIVDLVGVEANIKNGKAYAVLLDSDGNAYKYELVKEVAKTTTLQKGFDLKTSETTAVNEAEILQFTPPIFLEISKLLTKHGSVKAHISFSETTFKATGVVYRSLFKSDVETIYIPVFHKTTEILEQQLEKQKNAEARLKGKSVVI